MLSAINGELLARHWAPETPPDTIENYLKELKMKTRKLGKLEVSQFGFGCMGLGANYGHALSRGSVNAQLFDTYSLKSVTLRNRIAASPMCQHSADTTCP